MPSSYVSIVHLFIHKWITHYLSMTYQMKSIECQVLKESIVHRVCVTLVTVMRLLFGLKGYQAVVHKKLLSVDIPNLRLPFFFYDYHQIPLPLKAANLNYKWKWESEKQNKTKWTIQINELLIYLTWSLNFLYIFNVIPKLYENVQCCPSVNSSSTITSNIFI